MSLQGAQITRQLVNPLPKLPLDADDIKAVLSQDLPCGIPVSRDYYEYGVEHFSQAVESDTPALDFEPILADIFADKYTEWWGTTEHAGQLGWDELIKKPLRLLHNALRHSIEYNRDAEERKSTSTFRTDFWLMSAGRTVLIGEEKSSQNDFDQAKAEVQTKLSCTSLPYVLAYAAAGFFVQFFALFPGRNDKGEFDAVRVPISDRFNVTIRSDRSAALICVFNIARIINTFDAPVDSFLDFAKIVRQDGSTIENVDNQFVKKVCFPFLLFCDGMLTP